MQLPGEPLGISGRNVASLPAQDVPDGRRAGVLAKHDFRPRAAYRLGRERFVRPPVPQQAVDVDARFVAERARPDDRLAGRDRPARGLDHVSR